MELGYTNVYCFKGGIPEWRTFNYPLMEDEDYPSIKINKISPKALYGLLQKDSSIFILDVCPIDCERDHLYIENSVICPMVYLEDWYHNIPKDRDIVIIDWANKKSLVAGKFLKKKGYKVIGSLKGGLLRWHAENMPVVEVKDPLKHITNIPCTH